MPAEQVGLVKENYLWKMLVRRGETQDGNFYHAPVGWNDQHLFLIVWGSATAALSYVFDKSYETNILTVRRPIQYEITGQISEVPQWVPKMRRHCGLLRSD